MGQQWDDPWRGDERRDSTEASPQPGPARRPTTAARRRRPLRAGRARQAAVVAIACPRYGPQIGLRAWDWLRPSTSVDVAAWVALVVNTLS